MFVLFEKKNRYTFRHNVHDNIQEMIPKQATYHSQEGDDTENSQENQESKITSQTADWSLQDTDDVIVEPLDFEDELGAEEDKTILQQRSQGIPHTSLQLLATRKELSQAKQQHSTSEDGRTCATSTRMEPSSNTPRTNPTSASYTLSGKRL